MTRISLAFLLAALMGFVPGYSQDEDAKTNNLVPNASFEEYEGSLRRKEQFDLTKEWINPTDVVADLYASGIKSRYVTIPDNMYGTEMPADGEAYAGIVTYSYRSKMSRSYLSVQLSEKLKEKTLYCVRFKASLAERSRYAANNLGVLIDKNKPNSKGTASITNSNFMVLDNNDPVEQTDGWWEFCKKFAGTGKEQYLTIGNFQNDQRTTTTTRELPEEYTEDGPISVAYYYIDQVEVEEIGAGEDCGCAGSRIPESKVIFSGSTQINDDMSLSEKVETIDAYFYQYKADVVSAAERTIDKIVDMMIENPTAKLTVVGHSDNEEVDLALKEVSLNKLAEKRAQNVKSYMVASGIDSERITVKSMDNKAPVSKMATPISLAKNRRVEFEVKQ